MNGSAVSTPVANSNNWIKNVRTDTYRLAAAVYNNGHNSCSETNPQGHDDQHVDFCGIYRKARGPWE